MTTKIYTHGGAAVTVRNPDMDGFSPVLLRRAAPVVCLDGTLRQHALPTKRAWSLNWTGLTSAEYTAITTQLALTTTLDFVAPTAATVYEVLVVGDVETPTDGVTYGVTCRLEQV